LSFAQSLARSGSITSDGRRRGYGPISPALSAFGNHLRGGSGSGSGSDYATSREGSGSGSGDGQSGSGSGSANDAFILQSPTEAHLGPARVATPNSSAMSSPPLTPLDMPWAGGLEETWSPSR
jgi:hypothetical protein